MKNKIIIAGIITALLFVYFGGMVSIIKQKKQFEVLQAKAKKEASYVEDLHKLQAEKQKYFQAVIEVSDKFYSDGRLFSLWEHLGKNVFGKSFVRLAISNSYESENGLKVFYVTITATTDPITYVKKMEKVVPPLYLVQLVYTANNHTVRGTFKGVILSDKDKFVITPDLMKANSYSVCEFIMALKDPNLIPNNPQYAILKKNGMYYVGIPIIQDVDILSAEAEAKKYASKGIITFIMQKGEGGA